MIFSLTDVLSGLDADVKTGDLKKNAAGLSARYRDKTTASGRRLMTGENDALAYALSRMPATYGAAERVFKQINAAFDGTEITTFADAGAGTGAATFAAFQTFPSLKEALCLEREPAVSGIGEKLTQKACLPARWRSFDLTKNGLSDTADLIACAYVLNELSDADGQTALTTLWNATGRFLAIIEPATPEDCRRLLKIRRSLIQKGAFIVAPCPHENDCPAGVDGWCHFSVRVARGKLHKTLKSGSAPYEDEKFSYLIASKEPPKHRFSRILRHPVTRSGCVDLTLCRPDGVIEKKTFSRRDGEKYKAAKKSNWGDGVF